MIRLIPPASDGFAQWEQYVNSFVAE